MPPVASSGPAEVAPRVSVTSLISRAPLQLCGRDQTHLDEHSAKELLFAPARQCRLELLLCDELVLVDQHSTGTAA